MKPCPFCVRIEKEEYDDTAVLGIVSFEPLNPVTPGHRLFVPKAHVASAADSPLHAALAMKAAGIELHDSGGQANIITSIGSDATQTVRHLHIHLVPRRKNDGLILPWTNQGS